MKKRILVLALLVVVALTLTATIVFAALEPVGTDTRTNGETTVTWDSSFADLDYALGETITMTVTWNVDVDEGVAEYVSFDLGSGSFTPRSRQDPAKGEIVTEAVQTGDNSVTIEFKFTGLHTCPIRDVEMGNAHFNLYLNVDMDGDKEPDKVVSYGVNVLVEEPH